MPNHGYASIFELSPEPRLSVTDLALLSAVAMADSATEMTAIIGLASSTRFSFILRRLSFYDMSTDGKENYLCVIMR